MPRPTRLLPLLVWLLAWGGAPEAVSAGLSPAQRASLAASGKVDADLLAALDEGDDVRVIVLLARGPRPIAERADAALRGLPSSFQLGRRYRAVRAFSGRTDAAGVAALAARSEVEGLGVDYPVTAQLGESIPLATLDVLHGLGITGQDVTFGEIDTGVDRLHANLAGAVIDERCYCQGPDGPGGDGCCHNDFDTDSGPGSAQDDHRHGTLVAGILLSNGTSGDLGGAFDAKLVAVKALDGAGGGFFSDIISGLNYFISDRPDVDVVNMSLGGGFFAGDCDDVGITTMAVAAAIDTLWDRGTIVFAGTGNNGNGGGMILPACVANAISVGAVWDEAVGMKAPHGCTDDTAVDLVACFTNSGATTDLMAPGAEIVSSKLGGGTSDPVAGTSYATPVAAACAALLLGTYPWLSPAQVEAALESSSTRVVDASNGLDFPRVDCAEAMDAVRQLVPASSPGGLATLVLLLCGGIVSVNLWRGRAPGRTPSCAPGARTAAAPPRD